MMQSSIHFPPFRQGRSVRHTEAVGTGSDPLSPHPGSAHLPPSSHTSARVSPCTRPAPWGAWGARGAACLMAGQGLLLAGSPGTGGSFTPPVQGGEAAQDCSLPGGGLLHWLRGHEHALTYHSGQRERGRGEPMYRKSTDNARHTDHEWENTARGKWG